MATNGLMDAPPTPDEMAATESPPTPEELAATANPGKPFDLAPIQKQIQNHIQSDPSIGPDSSFLDILSAGFEHGAGSTAIGMAIKEGIPNQVPPESSSMLYSIADQMGQLTYDLPLMVAGGAMGMIVGGSEGAAVGTVGGPPGMMGGAVLGGGTLAMAGAFAVPAAMRKWMYDYYANGGADGNVTVHDFLSRLSAATLEAAKGVATGGAAAEIGGAAAGLPIVKPASKTMVDAASQLVAATTIAKGLEGQLPEFKDFLTTALALGAVHTAIHVPGKLMGIWRDTGLPPAQIYKDALENPVLKEQILSQDPLLPDEYKDRLEGFKYKYKPMDTGKPAEGKLLYHGTDAAESELSTADARNSVEANQKFGAGVYLTDNPNVAKGISVENPQGTAQKVLAGSLTKDTKLFDLENPLPLSVFNILAKHSDDFGFSTGHMENETAVEQLKTLVDKPGRDVYDELKAAFTSQGLDKAAVQDKFVAINKDLVDAGYDGLRYQGEGTKVRNASSMAKHEGEHNAVVLFGNKEDGTLSGKLDPAELHAPALTQPYTVDLGDGFKSEALPKQEKIVENERTKKLENPPADPNSSEGVIRGLVKNYEGRNKYSPDFMRFYSDYVDVDHPIVALYKMLKGEGNVDAANNPEFLKRLALGSWSQADYAITKATFPLALDAKGERPDNGLSFQGIIEKHGVGNEMDAVRDYMVSERILELEGQGKFQGTEEVRKAALDIAYRDREKYQDVAKDFVDFQNRVSHVLVDGGILTEAGHKTMTEWNKTYFPAHKFLESKEASDGGGTSMPANAVRNPIKAIGSSDLSWLDPFQSIIKNTQLFYKIANENIARQALRGIVENNPEGADGVMWKVAGSADFAKIAQLKEKISNLEKAVGISPNELAQRSGATPSEELSNVLLSLSRKSNPFGENQFPIFVNGKAELWEAHPLLARAINGLDTAPASLLLKSVTAIADLQREGVILHPNFIGQFVTRHGFMPFIGTKEKVFPFYELFSGFISKLSNDKYAQDAQKMGALPTPQDMLDDAYAINKVHEFNTEVPFIDKGYNVIKNIPAGISSMIRFMSESIRVGEYKKLVNKGYEPTEAAFEARDVNVDQARIGAKMHALSMATPFMNSEIQANDKFARTIKDDPKGLSIALGSMMAISTLVNFYNQGSTKVAGAQNYEKDMYWLFDANKNDPNSPPIRVSKPWGPGVLTSVWDRALDHWRTQNPHAFDGWIQDVVRSFTPNIIMGIAKPVIEQLSGKSFLTGQPLVSSAMEKVSPVDRYNEGTSDLAKGLAKLIPGAPYGSNFAQQALPPVMIDNWIRDITGPVGRDVLRLLEAAKRNAFPGKTPPVEPPTSTASDTLFSGAFRSRYPNMNDQRVLNFENDSQEINKAWGSLKMHMKNPNELAAAEDVMERGPVAVQATEISKAISLNKQMIHGIIATPALNGDQKRYFIDGKLYENINLGIRGSQLLDQSKAALADIQKRMQK